MASEAQSPVVALASLSTNHGPGPIQFTGEGGSLPLVSEELPWEGAWEPERKTSNFHWGLSILYMQ